MKYIVTCSECGWSVTIGPQKDAKRIKSFHTSTFYHFNVFIEVAGRPYNDVPERRSGKPWNSETCH